MRDVAIIGAGMTLFRRRLLETPRELAGLASSAALEEAGMGAKDIDCIVLGNAPDDFDGLHRVGDHVGDVGGGLKPVVRVYAGGATGVLAPIAGWWHVASGACRSVLVVAEAKMSPVLPHPQAVFAYMWDPIIEQALSPNLLWVFALEMRRYMHECGLGKEQIALVSVKNKRNALDHPSAQAAATISVEDVLKSEVLVWPVQRLDVAPVSDGAAALVMVRGDDARSWTDTPVWVRGVGWSLDSSYWYNRELGFPRYVAESARMAYRMARVERPEKEIHVVEPYDAFDYKELHNLEGLGLAPRCGAAKMLEEGLLDRDGELPTTPSGGLLGVGNPISAAGVMKVAELFWQLRGQAGARQVRRSVERGLAQTWGDLMQASTVIILEV